MQPRPHGFGPDEGPGYSDMVLAARLQNPYLDRVVTLMSSEEEFGELNGKTLQPGEQLEVSLFVPAGFREFIKGTEFKGKPYIYIGLQDKDAPDPVIYKPRLP